MKRTSALGFWPRCDVLVERSSAGLASVTGTWCSGSAWAGHRQNVEILCAFLRHLCGGAVLRRHMDCRRWPEMLPALSCWSG